MGQDIFVGVLCVIAAAAGIWCWIFDNGEPRKEVKTEIEEKVAD